MKKNIIVFGILFLSSFAKAGFLIDPYIGYHSGSLAYKYKAGSTLASLLPGDYSDTLTGYGLGLRAAYTIASIAMVGVEYNMYSGKDKPDKNISTTELDADSSTIYAIAGASLPKFRGWLGYGLSDTTNIKSSSGTTTKMTGTSIKVGLGVTVMKMVAINFEYVMHTISTLNSGGADYSKGDYYEKLDYTNYLLSLSVPLKF